MDTSLLVVALIALAIGGLIGWLFAGRQSGGLKAERDGLAERFKTAVTDLEKALTEKNEVDRKLSAAESAQAERDRSHKQQLAQIEDAKAALSAQFREVGQTMLDHAQKTFLDRADARFKESETTAGLNLKALLSPVHERLEKYEAAVAKVEAERRDAFGMLSGQIETMRGQTQRVSDEAAKLVNALRNAPKARGRWGEQQLKNVLESCGLSEHADFQTEVSVTDGDGGRLRPDVVIKIPGGQSLVIDAKVSLNAYQDAFGAVDEGEKAKHLDAHALAMRAHVNALGAKAYWNQFDDTPDFVVMFVPGEHFLAAALDQDHELWDYAFERKVLLATPTNLIAIARTVAAVWRQEKLANQARDIAALGKELYARIATMGEHIVKVGRNIDQAAGAYNAFVGSFEDRVLSQARKFESLDIETGDKEIPVLPIVERTARPLAKLAAAPAAVNDAGE
jgi:DNA recombination protein RmuC